MVILFYIIIAGVLLYSIILHELAHAKASDMLGDPTPRYSGRLTLNPIPHLDPIGTLLPLFLFISGAPIVFGWAKPVPINPYNYRDVKKGTLIVSSAGIIANIFIAWLLATVLKIFPFPHNEGTQILRAVLDFGVRINIVLAVFNLIPIPPLDGSKILSSVLPYEHSAIMFQLERYGFFILIFILIFPPTQMLLFSVINLVYRFMTMSIF